MRDHRLYIGDSRLPYPDNESQLHVVDKETMTASDIGNTHIDHEGITISLHVAGRHSNPKEDDTSYLDIAENIFSGAIGYLVVRYATYLSKHIGRGLTASSCWKIILFTLYEPCLIRDFHYFADYFI